MASLMTPEDIAIADSLRRRAQALQHQVTSIRQHFAEQERSRITADVVHEMVALNEESRYLNRLATYYERVGQAKIAA